jgi:hypothetical protein
MPFSRASPYARSACGRPQTVRPWNLYAVEGPAFLQAPRALSIVSSRGATQAGWTKCAISQTLKSVFRTIRLASASSPAFAWKGVRNQQRRSETAAFTLREAPGAYRVARGHRKGSRHTRDPQVFTAHLLTAMLLLRLSTKSTTCLCGSCTTGNRMASCAP